MIHQFGESENTKRNNLTAMCKTKCSIHVILTKFWVVRVTNEFVIWQNISIIKRQDYNPSREVVHLGSYEPPSRSRWTCLKFKRLNRGNLHTWSVIVLKRKFESITTSITRCLRDLALIKGWKGLRIRILTFLEPNSTRNPAEHLIRLFYLNFHKNPDSVNHMIANHVRQF